MTLAALLEAIAEARLEVRYDGQHVRVRPEEALTDELRVALKVHRDRLVWLCLHRVRPDELRPAWEFWFWPEWWDDFCRLKQSGSHD